MIAVLLFCIIIILAPIFAAIPDEAFWSPMLYAVGLIGAAAALVLPPKPAPAGLRAAGLPLAAMALFVAVCVVSLLAQWLGVHHGRPVFMDAMLRQTGAYLALVAIAASISRVCVDKLRGQIVTVVTIASATAVALYGLQHWFLSVATFHTWNQREFGTSTPDYFAALFVMTIPVTAALFIGTLRNTSKIAPLIYAASLLVQLAVMNATGSRFALIALFVGIVTLVAGLISAARHGAETVKMSPMLAAAIAVVLLVGGAVGAKTIYSRIHAHASPSGDNSAMFRWWTWKGTEKMALAHPKLGTGPGTYVYSYQRYAFVGFTRAAHNAYFQATAETGFAGGAVLLVALVWTAGAGFKSIKRFQPEPEAETPAPSAPAPRKGRSAAPAAAHTAPTSSKGAQFLAAFGVSDERILIAGLAGGFIAGLVQNLIDSDWYVTFDGIVLWTLAGLLLAYVRRAGSAPAADSPAKLPMQLTALLGAAGYIICAIGFAAMAAAEGYAQNAAADMEAGNASAAVADYNSAIGINSVRGKYYSDLGQRVYPAAGMPDKAESALKQAIAIEPNATNYRRLGKLYLAENRPADALAQFQAGTACEWNDLDLYLLSAQAHTALGDTQGTLDDYRLLAAFQSEKIAQYPAIGDVVELRYAQADVPLGNDELAHGSFAAAASYFTRARTPLETYIDEGGTTNSMRSQLMGGAPDPAFDTQMFTLYQTAMQGLVKCDTALGKTAEAAKAAADLAANTPRFHAIIAKAGRPAS